MGKEECRKVARDGEEVGCQSKNREGERKREVGEGRRMRMSVKDR